jgi:receptor protein-tyrosine kinase
MTIRDYLSLLRKWWWALALGAFLGGAGAWAVSNQMTPTYRATAVLLVNQPATGNVFSEVQASQLLAQTYSELVTSRNVLARAVEGLGASDITLGYVQDNVRATTDEDTQLIEVSAEASSPERAALIANAVAGVFPEFVREVQIAAQTDEESLNSVSVVEQAEPPTSPVFPRTNLNIALGVFLGVGLMVGIIAFIEYLNDYVDDRREVEALNAPFLGSVPRAPVSRGTKTEAYLGGLFDDDPRSPMAEAYRQLQASLAFALSTGDTKVLVVTSAVPNEGKTATAVNLARALSEASQHVLLLDGDLRKPDVRNYLPVPDGAGLAAAFISDSSEPSSFAIAVSDTLSVLPAGRLPANPGALLSSHKMRGLISRLRDSFDLVIIDSPPVIGLADAVLWAGLADGVVLVARSGKTRRGNLQEAARTIAQTRTPLIGVVINDVTQKTGVSGYYYGYGEPRPEKDDRPEMPLGLQLEVRAQDSDAIEPAPAPEAADLPEAVDVPDAPAEVPLAVNESAVLRSEARRLRIVDKPIAPPDQPVTQRRWDEPEWPDELPVAPTSDHEQPSDPDPEVSTTAESDAAVEPAVGAGPVAESTDDAELVLGAGPLDLESAEAAPPDPVNYVEPAEAAPADPINDVEYDASPPPSQNGASADAVEELADQPAEAAAENGNGHRRPAGRDEWPIGSSAPRNSPRLPELADDTGGRGWLRPSWADEAAQHDAAHGDPSPETRVGA